MRSRSATAPLLCPSARADMDETRVFGVIEGTASEPQVRYLKRAAEPPPDVEALCGPVAPEELFRFAAPCARGGCVHFNGQQCGLGERIAQIDPHAAGPVPRCAIRNECRWWHEQGPSACATCSRVVTEDFAPPDGLRQAAQVDSAKAAPG